MKTRFAKCFFPREKLESIQVKPDFKEMLKEGLSSGQSYPAARMKALLQLSDINQDTLSTSNNILALEYLTAIKKTGIRPDQSHRDRVKPDGDCL